MQTPQNSLELFYPQNSGFVKTNINFFSGTPDLLSFYLNPAKTEPSLCRLFVTDETIASLPCMQDFIRKLRECTDANTALVILGAGESFKTIESVLTIVKTALDKNFTRNSLFIGIGGGVICDMTGFAASMFKRGVKAEFVPTTLLADVDASIGGKTGCDFESYKNMIGAFYPACNVNIWPDFTKTLSEREFMSGLAEAIKTAFLFSKDLLNFIENNRDQILRRESESLSKIIYECAKAKADIVHNDFREKGERAFLNLGHTFGHALESTAGLGVVTHGEGVAWGIARALDLTEKLRLCEPNTAGNIDCDFVKNSKKLLASFGYDTNPVPKALLSDSANPENAKQKRNESAQKILSAMKKDKKNISTSKIRVILQKNYSDTLIQEVDDSDILAVLQ